MTSGVGESESRSREEDSSGLNYRTQWFSTEENPHFHTRLSGIYDQSWPNEAANICETEFVIKWRVDTSNQSMHFLATR